MQQMKVHAKFILNVSAPTTHAHLNVLSSKFDAILTVHRR